MPHEHPFGPPDYVPYVDAVIALEHQGLSQNDANIGAAIAMASSTVDTRLIDDTPGLAKYLVGAWQINYYGAGYQYLATTFGTPHQLVDAGLDAQAHATAVLFRANGWIYWPAFQTGAYKQYLTGTGPNAGSRNVSIASEPAPTDTSSDSWSDSIYNTAFGIGNIAYIANAYGELIRGLLR